MVNPAEPPIPQAIKQMKQTTILVLCTCPPGNAKDIAQKLVQQKLAACVNIMPNIRSIYHWQGEIQDDTEAMLVIKTTTEQYEKMEKTIKKLHPYELPEIISISLTGGNKDYIQWIKDTTDTK